MAHSPSSSTIQRTDPPFVLVDGSYFMFRAYFGMPTLKTSTGLATHAVRGSINALNKLIKRYNPTHMAVVFDTKEPTFRHELSADYKAHREAMPDDLAEQIPYLHAVIKAMGLPLLALPGLEADDLIGTLAKRAEQEGHHVVISTGDKDMAQLVNENIMLEDSFRERQMRRADVFEKFGVYPEQIVDYLTLMGDASDGIKGIPGIGPKTAAKLLQEYGTLGAVLQNAHLVKGKVGQNLIEHAELIPMNHQLASIVVDLPLDFDWHQMRLTQPDTTQLATLYTELEFRGALAELRKPDAEAAFMQRSAPLEETHYPTSDESLPEPKKAGVHVAPEYTLAVVDTLDALQHMVQTLLQCEYVCVYVVTDDVHFTQAQPAGIALSASNTPCYYVPLTATTGAFSLDAVKPLLNSLCSSNVPKIGYDLKRHTHWLANMGITLNTWQHDIMLASYVLQQNTIRHTLDVLALQHLNHTLTPYEAIAGKGAKQQSSHVLPVRAVATFAAEQVWAIQHIYIRLVAQLATNDTAQQLLMQTDMPVSRVLCSMEAAGVCLDVAFVTQLGITFAEKIKTLEAQAYDMAGTVFNLASPKQLGEILFERLGIEGGKKTATGQYATGEAILEKIDHPIIDVLLEYRTLSKLKNTYTEGLLKQVDPQTGRVHTTYNQALTATGRLSSTDPNLQNIPIRTEVGRQLRKAFVAKPEHVLIAADYSQIELRLMAHYSEDDALLTAFNNGLDIHVATAAEVLGTAPAHVTADQRRQAKAVNFGLLYGMSAFGLAKQLQFTRSEAQSYIERYFDRYPGIREYMYRAREQAHDDGYVETLLGRKLYTPDIKNKNAMVRQAAERAAINAPLQGSAAEIIKLAMLAVVPVLDAYQAQLLLQVHDELVFEAPIAMAEQLAAHLKDTMEQVTMLRVPLIVDVGIGVNWDEAH